MRSRRTYLSIVHHAARWPIRKIYFKDGYSHWRVSSVVPEAHLLEWVTTIALRLDVCRSSLNEGVIKHTIEWVLLRCWGDTSSTGYDLFERIMNFIDPEAINHIVQLIVSATATIDVSIIDLSSFEVSMFRSVTFYHMMLTCCLCHCD